MRSLLYWCSLGEGISYFWLVFQVIESDEDVLSEVDDDLDEEHVSEPDVQEDPKLVVKYFPPAIVSKEPEKQLSKKEIRKKELEELDALLADLNITPTDKNGLAESQGIPFLVTLLHLPTTISFLQYQVI